LAADLHHNAENFGVVLTTVYHAARKRRIGMLFVANSSAREPMQDNGHIRILLVDDHEPFRRYVYSMLQEQEHMQVIGEAKNGLEAVERAETLQPDVILLDIGLPGINGIEAARQIAESACKARIIFLTQEVSTEVVEEAFDLGAWAYITKVQAGAELLPAVESVSRGERFVNDNNNNKYSNR
jgi:DNA-binding NarL/FixJ family response regulator